jgi:DNA-directed RNA polymerase subunit H
LDKPKALLDKPKALDHELVPKHALLTKEEMEKLFSSLSISSDNLPKIRIDDAGIVGLEAKKGDIIKIMRDEPTGKHVYYRVVV